MEREEENMVGPKHLYLLLVIICVALCSVMAFKQSLIKEKKVNPKIEIHGKISTR